MLKLFRKKIVSKIILWSLLILILPAFVMWGSASMSRSKDKGPDYAGIINNKKVSFGDLAEALSGVRTQIILNYFDQPKVLDAVLGNRPVLAKLAWDRLLMLNEAKKLKIKVSNKEVVNSIRTHPLFIRDGVFDDRFYVYMLRNNIGLEPRAFEESVRENLMLRELTVSFTKDSKIPEEEVRSEYNKESGRFKITYIMIEPKDTVGDITVDEKAAKEFYEKHKNELVVKSTLKGALPDRVATFDEAREAIEKRLKETQATQVVKEKAEETYKKIQERMRDKNETFAKAVAGRGLDLKETGFFSRNDKLEEIGDTAAVYNAASALKEFQVSEPVDAGRGFIIFELVEKKPADEEAFKKDKDEYIKKIRERKASLLMQDWLKKIEDDNKPAIKLEEIDKYYR